MSAQSERLLRSLSEIREDYIEEASEDASEDVPPRKRKRKKTWKRWALLAACLVLVVTGAGILTGRLPLLGGGSGGQGTDISGDEAPSFAYYAGPVLPLSLGEPTDAISAEREITLDFLPWVPEWQNNEENVAGNYYETEEERQEDLERYNRIWPEGGHWISSNSILVTDTYTLINTSEQDQTVTALYPFVGDYQQLESETPVLTLDGLPLDTDIRAGQISATLVEDDPNTGSRVITGNGTGVYYADNWQDYQNLLEDGSYQKEALLPPPVPTGTCYVYTFSLAEPAEEEELSGADPDINLEFRMDYAKTQVYSIGCYSGTWAPDDGFMKKGGRDGLRLIVIGEDIQDLKSECQIRQDDKWVTVDTEISTERREADVNEILKEIAMELYTEQDMDGNFDLFYELFLDGLEACFRYENGNLDSFEFMFTRVFYLTADLTIPAGTSVTLSAVLNKEGSHDFACQHRGNRGLEGYDVATRMGSLLNFRSQNARLEDRGQIEIVSQNFGFDLETGVREASLTEDAYWLVVRRAPDSAPNTN